MRTCSRRARTTKQWKVEGASKVQAASICFLEWSPRLQRGRIGYLREGEKLVPMDMRLKKSNSLSMAEASGPEAQMISTAVAHQS